MFDDFFFPYERAKLWTRDMVILSLSNFFSLYFALYHVARTSFVDGATLVLQLCGSRGSRCRLRIDNVSARSL